MINQYEQFGSNYRQPRPYMDDGGPANNPANPDEDANRDGRPRTAQPEDGQPAEDTRQQAPQPAPAPAQSPGQMAAAPPAPQQTFQQMQAQGIARPPAPMTNPMVDGPNFGMPADGTKGGAGSWAGGMPTSGTSAAANMVKYNDPNMVLKQLTPAQQQEQQTALAPNAPGALPANGGMEGQLKNAWEGYQPQNLPQGGSPEMRAQIEKALSGALGNPSRYDTNVAKDSFNMLAGNIDDDYNARDQGLRESIASRGLGSIGDSSIGTGDQRFQNLQRRSAKQDMASNILREQANTYGSDRSSAIRDAMGYGNDQFGNNLQGAQFNANQKQQAYQNYTGYGQQAFDNQERTNAAKRTQDLDQQNLLMKMLGLG